MNLFYTWGAILGPFVAGAIYHRTQSYAQVFGNDDRFAHRRRDERLIDQTMGPRCDNRGEISSRKIVQQNG